MIKKIGTKHSKQRPKTNIEKENIPRAKIPHAKHGLQYANPMALLLSLVISLTIAWATRSLLLNRKSSSNDLELGDPEIQQRP